MNANDEPIATVSASGSDTNSATAALASAGIGCLAMGIVTTLSEASKPAADMLNLYKPAGPLSGKSLVAIIVWLVAWVVLHGAAKRKRINTGRWITLSLVCVVCGLVSTFPLFFDMFGDK